MGCPGWTYETYEERHFVAEQTVTEATRRPTEAQVYPRRRAESNSLALLGRREGDSAGAPGCGNVLADQRAIRCLASSLLEFGTRTAVF
jgi:hypothetical protein